MTLLDSDGNLVAAPLAAAVTVASVDSCTMVACPAVAVQPPVNAMETRIVVTAGAQSWTLYLTNTAMPSDLVKVGDAFDMTVQASTDIQYVTSISQTVVLAHGADLVLFAADLSTTLWVLPATVAGGQPPPLPNLNAFGITLVDRGTDLGSAPLGLRRGTGGAPKASGAASQSWRDTRGPRRCGRRRWRAAAWWCRA
jgi:hypothetical protein